MEPRLSLPGICTALSKLAHVPIPALRLIPSDAKLVPEKETPHHGVNTFSNYAFPAGEGEPIPPGHRVEVSCKVFAPSIASVVPDGYWYRIASAPWRNGFYAPANTFLNGDPPNGPYLHNTDFSVPTCKPAELGK